MLGFQYDKVTAITYFWPIENKEDKERLQRVLKTYRGVSRCRTSVNYFYLGEDLNLASLSYHIADLPKYVSQSQNPYDFARSGDKQRLVMAHH